ncbi:MAG TPA: M15 family metallopeptidase [Candidatus Limiplasma stercoravium]|nr:M15 family metallopeptidase [Candidatus Limiplasma stercoravium]
MRINANKKVHKRKRDPFELLARTAGVLVVALVVGIGVFYLCTLAITNDYNATRDAIAQQNEEAEVEFNAKMNALRENANAALDPDTGELTAKDNQYWEAELGGSSWRVVDESTSGLENTSTITLDRSSLINGGLLLVNAWHPMPSDFSEDGLISVGVTSNYDIQVADSTVSLFPVAYNALYEAIQAAREEGLDYYLVQEGYRSYAQQEVLFNNELEKLSTRYSGDLLYEEAKKGVNAPGTSDYQTGMTVRLDVYQRDNAELNNQLFQAESAQGAWMTENCWKYGFIFRFPTKDFPNSSWEDKSYKTGITATLNMYRYVGKAHAAAMRMMNLCLEEYIEFLIKYPHICIYENNALKYEIVRIKVADGVTTMDLPVPNPASEYQASLDNMGGVVMAYTYNN